MNIKVFTLGCKVNQYETQVIRESFIDNGFTNEENLNNDIIIINSCTVTAESDRKTRQLLRKCRRENPDAVIVLTGCMVQAFPEKSTELIEADIIIGNRDVSKIVKVTKDFLENRNPFKQVEEHKAGDLYSTPSLSQFADRTRAFMKIEDGCDRFCSYCIIPKARGRVRSRKLSDIAKEAKLLANKGYSEIVLVGINLSAYGKGSEINLCDAVETVCGVEGIKRVRLGSLEPDHITDEMLTRLKSQEKFCPQFHLSLQSGCDQTLKRMNRHYDCAFYYDLICRIRTIFDNPSITTDIMVGFAGETEEEFNQSLEFAKKVGFAQAHIFAYSRRKGTIAAELKNQVTNSIKEKRAKLMAQVTKESQKEFLENQCGRVFPVLFEENNYGYTPNYSRVFVCTEENLMGQIKSVEIVSVKDGICIGNLV